MTGELDIGPEVDWEPQHLALSAWLEHVPFAFWLMKVLRPACFVELGTERGVSYGAFCQAVDRLGVGARGFGVDTWRGDAHAGHYDESVFDIASAMNDRCYRRFSSLLRMTFIEALPYFENGEIDLLHIDGLHTYDAVAADFNSWRPKLSDRAVVLFHDTNVHRDDFGVWRLWRELSAEYPHFEFPHGHGLGILGVGKHQHRPARALFGCTGHDSRRMAINQLFAARGAAVQRAYDFQSLRERAAVLSAEVTTRDSETSALRDQVAAMHARAAAAAHDAAALRAAAASYQTQAAASQAEAALRQAELAALRNQCAADAAAVAALQQNLAIATDEVGELNKRLSIEAAWARDELVRRFDQHIDATKQQNTVEAGLQARFAAVEAHRAALLTSTCWQITAPLRAVKIAFSGGSGRSRVASRPPQGGGRWRGLPGRQRFAASPSAPPRVRRLPPIAQTRSLRLRVLIVAELSVPQCKKYRVDQKREMIRSLGCDCTTISWHDADRAITLMQTHSVVIFYRVPALDNVLRCIAEAKALQLPCYFEVDDLIFDIDDYAVNPNLLHLDAATKQALLEGAGLYRQALKRCGDVIASTPYLAKRMQAVGGGSSTFIENALDAETMQAAATVRRRTDGMARIFYGSGTRTHDADLALIAPALKRVADEHANVEIVLIGELKPPEELLRLGERLRLLPACPYPDYLAQLGEADIAIAPLAPGEFNEAKSNIKFLEAAAVGVASVCSPRSAFAHAIRQNETGILAESVEQWHRALTALVTDPNRRRRIGEAARRDVLERYSPAAIASQQLAPLLSKHRPAVDPRLHVLQVNVFYRPQSYGGATIVTEELTRHLQRDPDTRVSVFSRAPNGWIPLFAIERGDEDGVAVFRMGLQDDPGMPAETWGETAAAGFREVLRALRPDVVHFHSMQSIGAASLLACRAEGIPFVVTLHDAWWVCERQFLVNKDGKYCGQQKISLNVCAACVDNIGMTAVRNQRLREALESADLLLTPSERWRQFYIANGFAPGRIVVNANGVQPPAKPAPNKAPARLRFGFVAGSEAVKGFPLLKRSFEALGRDDWELVLVNHGQLLGHDSYHGVTWRTRGTVRIVPPFDADGRDAFYDSIDVLLFPSQWPESFGLTVREALMRNKWVIATDQGGVADAVQPGINGTLIPITDDIEPLLTAITDLLDRKPDLAGWVNPATDGLRDFAAQSTELRRILQSVTASKRRAVEPPPDHRVVAPAAVSAASRRRVAPPASHAGLLRPRVLLVAELSLPQCKKYRVDQKCSMITALGWECTVVSWRDADLAVTLMQSHSLVVFYRVPAFPSVLQIIDEAETLSLARYFELDDLIFDLNDYAANPNLLSLDATTFQGLIEGAALYRRALERCGNVIASTPYLADRMQAAGGGSATVIENALDEETLSVAAAVPLRTPDGTVRIVYGSGTRTHDADFGLISVALQRVIAENSNVELVIVGELTPPRGLLDVSERLRRLPVCPYPQYLALLASCDIAIAPLVAGTFNEAKSNIKFLEAASVGVPSVCSPRSPFAQAIRHDETGFLAATLDDWYAALTTLVTDPALRLRIGQAARREVLQHYSPDAIGRRQLQPLLAKHQPAADPRLHVLQVNVLCAPQSFGGATVVMEEMAQRLDARPDTRVSLFTSAPAGWIEPYAIERGEIFGMPVFRVGIQDNAGWMQAFWDDKAAAAFRQVLRALRPDVVHFHAIQGIGAACLTVCRDEKVPFVVTLHDAWWVCERQFLVTGEGRYCGQTRIDANVCARCVPDIGVTVLRNLRLRQALDDAALLLTPSRHWRRFHIANGFAPDRLVVNENGIKLPDAARPNNGPARLRFGFVAGAETVKGFPLLKRVFEALDRDDWELVLVNHGLSMGMDSFAGIEWTTRGTVRTVPPFRTADRDSFYDQIDVLLFPSQWPESFGLTVREAMVRNKWVIATDQGGAAEAIEAGVNGTLMPIGDAIGPMRKAVEDLLDRRPDLAGWINPGSDHIRDFSAQAVELRGMLAAVASAARSRRADAVDAVA